MEVVLSFFNMIRSFLAITLGFGCSSRGQENLSDPLIVGGKLLSKDSVPNQNIWRSIRYFQVKLFVGLKQTNDTLLA